MNLVSMAHPDLAPLFDGGKKPFPVFHFEKCMPILSFLRRFDLSSQNMSHDLEAVTDAENGNAQMKDLFRNLGGVGSVYTLRSTRKDYGAGIFFYYPGFGQIEGEDLRVHAQFSDLPGDQLGVLGAKIEDKNLIHGQILTIATRIEKGEISFLGETSITFIISRGTLSYPAYLIYN
jgi:hypothetical protein